MHEDVYWMNVDTPTKRCTVHRVGRAYEIGKYETAKKGIKDLKEDGGWLIFPWLQEAETHDCNNYQQRGYDLSLRCRCLTQGSDHVSDYA